MMLRLAYVFYFGNTDKQRPTLIFLAVQTLTNDFAIRI